MESPDLAKFPLFGKAEYSEFVLHPGQTQMEETCSGTRDVLVSGNNSVFSDCARVWGEEVLMHNDIMFGLFLHVTESGYS